MPRIVPRTPPDARDFTVPVTGEDGIQRDRTMARHTAEDLFLFSKRDQAHVAIPKRALFPEGMWDACAFLIAAAEAEGVSIPVLIARLHAEMPEQLQANTDLDGIDTTTAPSGPDLMEHGSHASSSRDRSQDA